MLQLEILHLPLRREADWLLGGELLCHGTHNALRPRPFCLHNNSSALMSPVPSGICRAILEVRNIYLECKMSIWFNDSITAAYIKLLTLSVHEALRSLCQRLDTVGDRRRVFECRRRSINLANCSFAAASCTLCVFEKWSDESERLEGLSPMRKTKSYLMSETESIQGT